MGLFSLFGTLGLKTADFEAGMKRAESVASKAGTNIANDFKGRIASMFTVDAVENWGRKILERVGNIKDSAENLGLTFQEVQELESAAFEGNSTMEKAGAALEKFTMARAKAVGGNPGAIAAFNELGLSMSQVSDETVSNLTLWRAIGTELNGSNPSMVQRVALMQLLGKSGAQLAPVLDALRKPAPENMISGEQITRLDEAKKNFERLQRGALNKSAPLMSSATEQLNRAATSPLEFLSYASPISNVIRGPVGEFVKGLFGSEKVQKGGTGFGNLHVAEEGMTEQGKIARDMSAAAKSLEDIKALIKSERDATND